jgi:hypothetical protein
VVRQQQGFFRGGIVGAVIDTAGNRSKAKC